MVEVISISISTEKGIIYEGITLHESSIIKTYLLNYISPLQKMQY